jgi:hypothetical protein
VSKPEIYRRLARMYKYTPKEIADMTPFQQYEMLNVGEDNNSGGGRKTISFDTLEEMDEWLTARQLK